MKLGERKNKAVKENENALVEESLDTCVPASGTTAGQTASGDSWGDMEEDWGGDFVVIGKMSKFMTAVNSHSRFTTQCVFSFPFKSIPNKVFGNENKANGHTQQLVSDDKQNSPNQFTRKYIDGSGEFSNTSYGVLRPKQTDAGNKCQQLPTLLSVVGQQCCVRLHGPKSVTGFKLP